MDKIGFVRMKSVDMAQIIGFEKDARLLNFAYFRKKMKIIKKR